MIFGKKVTSAISPDEGGRSDQQVTWQTLHASISGRAQFAYTTQDLKARWRARPTKVTGSVENIDNVSYRVERLESGSVSDLQFNAHGIVLEVPRDQDGQLILVLAKVIHRPGPRRVRSDVMDRDEPEPEQSTMDLEMREANEPPPKDDNTDTFSRQWINAVDHRQTVLGDGRQSPVCQETRFPRAGHLLITTIDKNKRLLVPPGYGYMIWNVSKIERFLVRHVDLQACSLVEMTDTARGLTQIFGGMISWGTNSPQSNEYVGMTDLAAFFGEQWSSFQQLFETAGNEVTMAAEFLVVREALCSTLQQLSTLTKMRGLLWLQMMSQDIDSSQVSGFLTSCQQQVSNELADTEGLD